MVQACFKKQLHTYCLNPTQSHSVDHRDYSGVRGAAGPVSGISKHTQTQKLCQDQGHSPLCSQNRCVQHHSRTKWASVKHCTGNSFQVDSKDTAAKEMQAKCCCCSSVMLTCTVCIYVPCVTVWMQVCPYSFIKLVCRAVNMVLVKLNPHGRKQTRWLRREQNIWLHTSRLKKLKTQTDMELNVTKIKHS